MTIHESSFLGDDEACVDPKEARFAILPVPYERTVSWEAGTADGPQAMIDASPYLEFYDEQLQITPAESGIWTSEPLEIPDGNPHQVVDAIQARYGQLLDDGHWVLMFGGEHGVTPGGVFAAAERHKDLTVIQFDAHADLRQEYHGESWNHACAMARSVERADVRAVGLRSYTQEEAKWMSANSLRYRAVHAWEMEGTDWWERILDGLEGRPVYVTFDLDYFDPSVMPATGTPEPGGCFWYPTLAFMKALFESANVVCGDIVELAPRPGQHHADFTAARLAHKMMAMQLLAEAAR